MTPHRTPYAVSALTWLFLATLAVCPQGHHMLPAEHDAPYDAAVQPAVQAEETAHHEATHAQLALVQVSQAQLASAVSALSDRLNQLLPAPVCNLSPPHLVSASHARIPRLPATCLQMRNQWKASKDGVYWLPGLQLPVYCDFSHDGGGWTLLLTADSKDGWDVLSVLSRNENVPSIEDNYSILWRADTLRNFGAHSSFLYRIEVSAESGRQQWGGIWIAPSHYSFTSHNNTQTEVHLVRKFNDWNFKDMGIENRMPWINKIPGPDGGLEALLTTSSSAHLEWWGTLVTFHYVTEFEHSPWIHPEHINSGRVLYWIREELA